MASGAEAPARRLEAGAAALGLDEVDQIARERMIAYLSLLERWNRVYNLTAVRDRDEMITRHLLDSLAVLPHVAGRRLLDVGTGAGLPGLVLAIARPALDVVLLDANAKRTRFCIQAVAELGLANVRVVQVRVDAHRDAGGFDCIVSRAFSSLAELVRDARHLLAPGGAILALKGREPGDELAALAAARLPGEAELVVLRVPGLDAARHLVRWRA